ncbi:MAG: hypothetical protein Q9M35_02485 [Rhodothermus sp.]|nr:hypothetical protein [Rhodothermus sp.]
MRLPDRHLAFYLITRNLPHRPPRAVRRQLRRIESRLRAHPENYSRLEHMERRLAALLDGFDARSHFERLRGRFELV